MRRSSGRATQTAALREYRRKRHFGRTPEPAGRRRPAAAHAERLRYVIHKHRATHLHYDLRLEWRGVLLSWAVPKGPSLDPSVKRLAMRVEDHPVDYATFEGVIPEGEYGAGTVMVWDSGTWEPDDEDVDVGLRRGELKFTLHGRKLKGSWVLIHTRGGYQGSRREAWLLIKHRDAYASTRDVTVAAPFSVLSGRTLAEIARAGGGNIAQAASGDPAGPAEDGGRPRRRTARRSSRLPASRVPIGE